ncbi:MAG: hypothetical protein KDB26_13640 [Microthrixaceae bacterium]|nr:hypothetical protein [Microthrixaceae bacterium]
MAKKPVVAVAPSKRWSELTDEEVDQIVERTFSKMVAKIPKPSESEQDDKQS